MTDFTLTTKAPLSIAEVCNDPRVTRYVCAACKTAFFLEGRRRGRRRHCHACQPAFEKLAQQARYAVKKAVEAGRLPEIRTLKCVDCGRRAEAFEHRSYLAADKLKVEPTCHPCNIRRGPAKWSST